MNRVVAADGERVAITRDHPDFKLRVGNLQARSHSRRAAVNRVKPKRVHIIREAAGAADAGDDDEIFAGHAKLREH